MPKASPRSACGRATVLLATAGNGSRACALAEGLSVPSSDMSGLVGTVTSSGATDLIFLCDRAVDHEVMRVVGSLGRKGLLPRSVLCGVCGTADTARHAWALGDHLDGVATEADHLSRIHDRWAQQTATAAAGQYLENRVSSSGTMIHSLIELLASNPESLTWPVEKVARSLGVGKTTLYGVLHDEGVPPVARWQMLFRLLEGCALLQKGALTEDAAYWAQLADGRSLRRALCRHLSTDVAQVRATEGWRWVVDRWMRVNPVSPGK
jgi:hypothetical protein